MIDGQRLEAILVTPTTSIGDAIAAIDRGALSIVLVVSPERVLLGTISDGDVRRAILRGVALEQPAHTIMNSHPTWVTPTTSVRATGELMRRRAITRIPVVDDELHVVGLRRIEELLETPKDEPDNLVVLMAGGLGQRLRPLTTAVPKPMLPVGGRPLLETLVLGFRDQGFRRIRLAVNYLSEVVNGHFGDGSAFGVDVGYLRETEPLGTIGALSLVTEPFERPVIVMNGDVLTKVNFNSLLEFHQNNGFAMTLCVRHYEFQVPYGVVELADARVASVEEKPVKGFFVNAGIYVLDPDVARTIPQGCATDATDIVQRLIAEGRPVGSFPVREYWIDVGSHADFERAGKEFVGAFLE